MTPSNTENEYVFAFAGDEQASPHFMRYSGLTGAAINAMSFDIFLRQAIDGIHFQSRVDRFSAETSWSNYEVVHRVSANDRITSIGLMMLIQCLAIVAGYWRKFR
jgi:hypothetical protein